MQLSPQEPQLVVSFRVFTEQGYLKETSRSMRIVSEVRVRMDIMSIKTNENTNKQEDI